MSSIRIGTYMYHVIVDMENGWKLLQCEETQAYLWQHF